MIKKKKHGEQAMKPEEVPDTKEITPTPAENQSQKELDQLKIENQNLKFEIALIEERKALKDKGIFNHQLIQTLQRIEMSIKEGLASLSKEIHDQTRLQAQMENIEVDEPKKEVSEVKLV